MLAHCSRGSRYAVGLYRVSTAEQGSAANELDPVMGPHWRMLRRVSVPRVVLLERWPAGPAADITEGSHGAL